MLKFIGVFCSFVLFVGPAIAFGASSIDTTLGNAYVAPLDTKEKIYTFIYTPKDWGDTVSGYGDGSFSVQKRFPDTNIAGSIDIAIPETVYTNKNISWIAKNYFEEYISKAFEVKNVKKSKVAIAGVTGFSTEYTVDTSTYISIAFVKSGKLYLVNAQAPNKFWKANKKAIVQSLATIQVGKFIIRD